MTGAGTNSPGNKPDEKKAAPFINPLEREKQRSNAVIWLSCLTFGLVLLGATSAAINLDWLAPPSDPCRGISKNDCYQKGEDAGKYEGREDGIKYGKKWGEDDCNAKWEVKLTEIEKQNEIEIKKARDRGCEECRQSVIGGAAILPSPSSSSSK